MQSGSQPDYLATSALKAAANQRTTEQLERLRRLAYSIEKQPGGTTNSASRAAAQPTLLSEASATHPAGRSHDRRSPSRQPAGSLTFAGGVENLASAASRMPTELTVALHTPTTSASSISSLSLSTGMVGPDMGVSGHLKSATTHRDDPVASAAASIKSQAAALGQAVSEMYKRSEGEGIAPALMHNLEGGSTFGSMRNGMPMGQAGTSSVPPAPSAGLRSAAPSAQYTSYSAHTGSAARAHYSTTAFTGTAGPTYAAGTSYSPARGQPYSSAASLGIATTLRSTHTGAYASPVRPVSTTTPYNGSPTPSGYYPLPGMAAPGGYMPSPPPVHYAGRAAGDAGRGDYVAGSGYVPSSYSARRNLAGNSGYAGQGYAGQGYVGNDVGYAARTAAGTVTGGLLADAVARAAEFTGHSTGAGRLYGAGTGGSMMQAGGDMGGGLGAAVGGAAAPAAGYGSIQGREEARLREMLQEMRHERRRLEDRLLNNDSQGIRLQDVRDDLEKQVGILARARDTLEAEAGGIAAAREAAGAAGAEVEALREALRVERAHAEAMQEARSMMEAKLAELVSAVDGLQDMHQKAITDIAKERDMVAHKYRKVSNKFAMAEASGQKAAAEVETLMKEIHARDVSLAEVKASAEVLGAANRELQAQLAEVNRDLEARVSELQTQLAAAQREAADTRDTASDAAKVARDSQTQAKEVGARAEFLRSEREKLLKVLAAEQESNAALRQELASAQAAVAASEAARSNTGSNLRAQLEAQAAEHEAHIASLTRQYEAQLAAAEKAAAAAQRQYSSSSASGEKLLEVHHALRRERDGLAAEAEALRHDLAEAQRERDELGTKVGVLRAEVKATMDDVMADREARVRSAQDAHEAVVSEMRAAYEERIAALSSDSDAKLQGVMDMLERMKEEVAEAQRVADKHKAAASHIKEQLREVIVMKDDLERDLAQEQSVNRELNTLLKQLHKPA